MNVLWEVGKKMRTITLDQLRRQYRGTRYAELINDHLSRQRQAERIAGIVGTIAMLPGAVQPHVEGFIDRWNIRGYEAEFWNEDAAQVLDEIVSDAQRLLDRIGVAPDDETLFNLFQIMTLSYAYSAYDQPKMRAFMGIPDYHA